MYHEGQRASEAMHNGIKYSTSILHYLALSLLLCCEGSGLLRQLSSGQPITLFTTEMQVKVSMRFSSRTGVWFYIGWKNVSYTQMRFLHASAYSPRCCLCRAPCLSFMPCLLCVAGISYAHSDLVQEHILQAKSQAKIHRQILSVLVVFCSESGFH